MPSNLQKDLGLILDSPLAPDQILVSLLLQSQELSLDRRQGLPGSHASRSSKRQHEATYKLEMLEQEAARREMQRVLGTLEPGYRKPKPIFPQSVLGHLFMRKFGLNREQRSLVIRSTGGSSRFLDVERILRAVRRLPFRKLKMIAPLLNCP